MPLSLLGGELPPNHRAQVRQGGDRDEHHAVGSVPQTLDPSMPSGSPEVPGQDVPGAGSPSASLLGVHTAILSLGPHMVPVRCLRPGCLF